MSNLSSGSEEASPHPHPSPQGGGGLASPSPKQKKDGGLAPLLPEAGKPTANFVPNLD